MTPKLGEWYRTCQECLYILVCKPLDESKPMPLSYEFKKCPKCKSEAFDYGTYQTTEEIE